MYVYEDESGDTLTAYNDMCWLEEHRGQEPTLILQVDSLEDRLRLEFANSDEVLTMADGLKKLAIQRNHWSFAYHYLPPHATTAFTELYNKKYYVSIVLPGMQEDASSPFYLPRPGYKLGGNDVYKVYFLLEEKRNRGLYADFENGTIDSVCLPYGLHARPRAADKVEICQQCF